MAECKIWGKHRKVRIQITEDFDITDQGQVTVSTLHVTAPAEYSPVCDVTIYSKTLHTDR